MLFWPIRVDRINQTTLWESKMMLERSSELLAELCSGMHHPQDFAILPGSARSTKCTVGVMLNGLTISEVIVGGPAFNCRQLLVGDKILKVDGIAVDGLTGEAIHAVLEGAHMPGSEILLTVYRQEEEVEETMLLRRMTCTEMEDNLKMFELFTTLESLASAHCAQGHEFSGCLEEVARLWTKVQLRVIISTRIAECCRVLFVHFSVFLRDQ
jgi:hypothetical protein